MEQRTARWAMEARLKVLRGWVARYEAIKAQRDRQGNDMERCVHGHYGCSTASGGGCSVALKAELRMLRTLLDMGQER
jgi:hypothetical protein